MQTSVGLAPVVETTENVTFLSTTVICEADGKATYRAVFTNELFGEQEFSVEVAKLGHQMVDDVNGTVTCIQCFGCYSPQW